MATVLDVSKYILEKLGEMTTLKLQKLVYYCQAWSLAWDGIPLFNEEFQAWANGPVCAELFAIHKGKFVIDQSAFKERTQYNFENIQIETINNVLAYYGDKKPIWLSKSTQQERPWAETRIGIPVGEHSDRIIEKSLMQEYYGGLT